MPIKRITPEEWAEAWAWARAIKRAFAPRDDEPSLPEAVDQVVEGPVEALNVGRKIVPTKLDIS